MRTKSSPSIYESLSSILLPEGILDLFEVTQVEEVFVYIPITQKVYRDSLYTAWVSGYSATLDSIELYDRIQTITIREKAKRKRFGIGLQVGYGFPHGAYAGVGLSYNLFNL